MYKRYKSAFLPAWTLLLLLFFRSNARCFVTSSNNNDATRRQSIMWGTTTQSFVAFIHSEESQTAELVLPVNPNSGTFINTSPGRTDLGDTTNSLESTSTEDHKGAIEVSAAIELPFPKAVAFDAFADLRRQATYSPWLKSVEYLEGANNDMGSKTRWKLSYLGLRFTWDSICTKQDRSNGILEWKSIAGLKNYGRATFHELSDGRTYMSMTLSIVVPRIATQIVGPKNLSSMLEKLILENTVQNFRQIVGENYEEMLRLQQQQQQQQQQHQKRKQSSVHKDTTRSKSLKRRSYFDFLSLS